MKNNEIRNIPINPYINLQRCWDLVNKANTFEKIDIAEEWLAGNKVITVEEYNDLMLALSFKSRELYRGRF